MKINKREFRKINRRVEGIIIIPKHKWLLYSPRVKLQGYFWIFKLGDVDDNPSVPHAHAKETGYRLNAWTGEIYPAGSERKRTIGKLTKKELGKLHEDPQFIECAKKQIDWYRSKYPHIDFFVPKWFRLKNLNINVTKGTSQVKTIEDYVFFGKAIIRKQVFTNI